MSGPQHKDHEHGCNTRRRVQTGASTPKPFLHNPHAPGPDTLVTMEQSGRKRANAAPSPGFFASALRCPRARKVMWKRAARMASSVGPARLKAPNENSRGYCTRHWVTRETQRRGRGHATRVAIGSTNAEQEGAAKLELRKEHQQEAHDHAEEDVEPRLDDEIGCKLDTARKKGVQRLEPRRHECNSRGQNATSTYLHRKNVGGQLVLRSGKVLHGTTHNGGI